MMSSYGTAMVVSEQPPVAMPPRSRGFLLAYGAAQAGAYIAFIPLLTLLLPLKAEGIAGADKALLLSQAATVGGLVAAAANLLFGTLSDQAGRWGRRRPWMLAALPAVALALALVGAAGSPTHLILAVVGFQLAMNALYAPLTALVPDMVPDRQKGTISALASAALPIANVFTALAVVSLSGAMAAQVGLVILASVVLILPLAVRLREPVMAVPPPRRRLSLIALRDVRFATAFVSRLLAESGVAIHTLFLLFLLQGQSAAARPADWSVLETFSALLVVATLSATVGGLVAGPLSDRVGRRAPFVVAGAVGMGAALVMLALWRDWPGPLLAQALFGLSHGVHAATVAAMNAEILPDRDRAGRDLGVMNLAVGLPQSLAPAIAGLVLTLGLTTNAVFVLAGMMTLAAAGALMPLLARA